MLLMLKEYINKYTKEKYPAYILRFGKNSFVAGFVKWNAEEAHGWHPPFQDDYVLYMIDTQPKLQPLRTGEADARGYSSEEYPYRLYLCGNDDFSMSYTFETLQEAKAALNEIEQNPSFQKLRQYGFVFTN